MQENASGKANAGLVETTFDGLTIVKGKQRTIIIAPTDIERTGWVYFDLGMLLSIQVKHEDGVNIDMVTLQLPNNQFISHRISLTDDERDELTNAWAMGH